MSTTQTNFYQCVIDTMQVGVWMIDTGSKTTFINMKMAALLGCSNEEMLGRPMSDFIIGTLGPLMTLQNRASDHLQNSAQTEVQLLRSDGSTFWVTASVSPTNDDHGNSTGILALITDITARKQADEKIRFQARLLDTAEQAILAVDLDGHILYRNRFTEKLYGISESAIDSPWVQELIIINRVSKHKQWSGELLVHCWDGTTFPALVSASPIHEDDPGIVIGMVITVTDISMQKQAERRIEHYVKRLENLHEIDRAILTARSPEAIAEATVTHIRQLIPCTRASITVFDWRAQESTLLAVQSANMTSIPAGRLSPQQSLDIPAELFEGRIYITDDIEKVPGSSEKTRTLRSEGILAYVRVPLMVQGDLIGSLNMGADALSVFTPERLQVAREVADQLAIAIQNAQLLTEVRQYATELEQHVAERTAELSSTNQQLQQEIHIRRQAETAEREQRALAEALRDTAAALNSTLHLDEVLDSILANVVRVVEHDVSDIRLVDSGIARVVRCRGYNHLGIEEAILAMRWKVVETPTLARMMETGQPLVITGLHLENDKDDLQEFQVLRSTVSAPIRSDGEVIGFITIGSTAPNFFTVAQAEQLRIFADQAALAIQNARLYERSQALAVLEERQRLAHELHDSVSQTLWSASLIADVLPDLWEQNAEEGRKTSIRLRQLARGALSEMRTLLLELHPTALIEVGFGELLQRLAEVTSSRTGIPITPVIEGLPILPPDVQIALYRIAQESLGNISRHATATQISVVLQCESDSFQLYIRDNGRGFSPERIRPGHLGLGIMRERAKTIGAALEISSEIGQGTEITVSWSAHGHKEASHHV